MPPFMPCETLMTIKRAFANNVEKREQNEFNWMSSANFVVRCGFFLSWLMKILQIYNICVKIIWITQISSARASLLYSWHAKMLLISKVSIKTGRRCKMDCKIWIQPLFNTVKQWSWLSFKSPSLWSIHAREIDEIHLNGNTHTNTS